MNDIDLSGHDWTPIGTETNEFSGNLIGDSYGKTISNFEINVIGNNVGLIGFYTGTCIKNLTLSDFSVTGSYWYVGGLVGYTNNISECTIENVHVQYGNVTGINYVSGLVGDAHYAIRVYASSAERMYVGGNCYLGGLVGIASDRCYINDSWVNCSEISPVTQYGGNVGGLVGDAFSANMNNASVMDCKIGSSGSSSVGGLIGWESSTSYYDGCRVENCTIVAGRDSVGGLVGDASITGSAKSMFRDNVTWVNATWVGGTSNVGALIGLGISNKSPQNAANPLRNNVWGSVSVTDTYGNGFNESPKTLDEAKSAGYCSVIDKKSLIAGKDYGNCRAKHLTYAANGATSGSAPASQVYPYNSTIPVVTVAGKGNLAKTGYLFNGWNTAADGSGISYQPGDTFHITADTTLYAQWMKIYCTITNTTGTFSLTSAMTKVYGDYGTGNGTAVLTFDSESKPVLTLTGFTASNMSGVPIIDASADLTIVLNGESKLTGSFENGDWRVSYGLLTVDGNLTIEGDTSSKLLVDNTKNSSGTPVSSIRVSKDLMINGAKVTATATSTSGSAYSIYAYNDISIGQNSVVEATATSTSSEAHSIYAYNDIFIGQNSVVDATATSTSSGALSIYAHNAIKIESASKVNANAHGEYNTYAMQVWRGNISLGQNSVVEATATSTSSYAYSIYVAYNDIKIESAKKVNATAESLGSEDKNAYGLYAGGPITITDSQDVTVTATAPYAYSILGAPYYDERAYDIVIANSKVTAKANGSNNAYALWSHAGSIKITGDKTVIDANATCTGQAGSGAGAILAYEDITITSAERIKAIGTNSSFVYNGSGYGSLNLNKLADYKFSNASVDGDEPTLYSTFVNPNNWYDSGTDIVSNFTAVLIEKKATTPSSSSKHSGSTVIQPNTVDTSDAADTSANMYVVNFSMNGHGIQVMNQSVSFGNTAEEPSPVPTADGYTFTGWYADKGLVSKYAFSTPVTDDIELYAGWTAKTPTSKSPAPFLGIIAGLGAAAVLLRLRK